MPPWWAVTILLLSLGYALYVVALYPLLLHWIAKRWPNPIRREPFTPKVSILLATHNGAAFLREKLDSILALDYPSHLIEIIVANDGSTDATAAIAQEYASRVTILNLPKAGKPSAVNRAAERATGDILVLTDVRQQLARASLRFLLENFADPRVGVVSAELQIRSGGSSVEENIGAYWKYERWIRLNLSALDSIFGATGSYYAVRRELAVPIPADALLDDMYLPLSAFFGGYRLVVDGRAKMFDYPTNLATEFGRKVRTLAGNYQILKSYPQLLTLQNRLLPHFLSYKFARLLLPFVLLAGAAASLLAGGWLSGLSLVAQCVLYGAAFLDPYIGEDNPLKRATSPLRTFFVMMLATICAVRIWFVPADRLWTTTQVIRRDAAA